MHKQEDTLFLLLVRVAFVAVLGVITFRIVTGREFVLLQGVNLLFHEAGHVLFFFFGRFVQMLGGTLGQLLIPTTVLIAFLRKSDFFGAFFAVWWIGQNLSEVSVYVGDARTQRIALIGGEHDWAYLLSELGLLQYDTVIARIIWISGIVLMVTAVLAGVVWLARQRRSQLHRKMQRGETLRRESAL